jgi:hypothetical protein
MPGAGFQKIAHETRELHQRARNVPFEAVKAAMVSDCVFTGAFNDLTGY